MKENMSQQLFEDDVKFLQRFLKSSGFDPGKIDGVFGSKTDAAENAFITSSQQIASVHGTFHQRSEQNIATLHIKAQEAARKFLKLVTAANIDARIISGVRSYAEQDKLFAKGRTEPGNKVTNAKGGQSNHNFGIAWDIGIFDSAGRYLSDSPLYDQAAQVGKIPELEWGGDWQSFKDKPHYQIVTHLSVKDIRERFEKGQSFV
jgi:peptidoglycan LD-endopeptidase CwlK